MMRAGIVPATGKVKARRKGAATGVGESARALEFNCYILPVFADTRLLAVGTKELNDFRISLLRKGLSVKSCRNIIDGSFRAMYRDARGGD